MVGGHAPLPGLVEDHARRGDMPVGCGGRDPVAHHARPNLQHAGRDGTAVGGLIERMGVPNVDGNVDGSGGTLWRLLLNNVPSVTSSLTELATSGLRG